MITQVASIDANNPGNILENQVVTWQGGRGYAVFTGSIVNGGTLTMTARLPIIGGHVDLPITPLLVTTTAIVWSVDLPDCLVQFQAFAGNSGDSVTGMLTFNYQI